MGVIGKVRKKLVLPLRVKFKQHVANSSAITQQTMNRKNI